MILSQHNLHSRNVVHRDVKGDNYLMDRKDTLTFEWWGKNLGPDCRVCREVGSCLNWKSLWIDGFVFRWLHCVLVFRLFWGCCACVELS